MAPILTHNTIYYVRVAEPHIEESRDYLLQDMIPLEPPQDFLVKAED